MSHELNSGRRAGGATVLVTGGAGFIGSNLCERLLARGDRVVAIDSFDDFYDPAIKRRNLAAVADHPRFALIEADVRDLAEMEQALASSGIVGMDVVVHLAARAGVRPSIQRPELYASVNVQGTVAVLELARRMGARRFVFGSSSSVYGNSASVPFSENDPADHPISPYAATKRAGELVCHTYRHLYGLSVACLRFFTVYGPRQRPDLAIHRFASRMLVGEPIQLFGDGSTERDYTYVDDIVQGVERAIDWTAAHENAFEIMNLGGNRTTSLARLVELIAGTLGVEPTIERLPAQPGDVDRTYADVTKAERILGYRPATPIELGIPRFVAWLRADGAG